MNAQRDELLARLPEHGWSLAAMEDATPGWWADEMWLLESTWSPVGARAYVTFLVDPMTPDVRNRKKGQGVWAVKASRARPSDWAAGADEFTLGLGQGWKERLPDLWGYLSKLRS